MLALNPDNIKNIVIDNWSGYSTMHYLDKWIPLILKHEDVSKYLFKSSDCSKVIFDAILKAYPKLIFNRLKYVNRNLINHLFVEEYYDLIVDQKAVLTYIDLYHLR